MDTDQFDTLARAMGTGTSRRRVVAGLGGGLLTGLLARRGATAAACAKRGQKPKPHKPCCGTLIRNAEGRCGPCPPEDFFATCDGKCGFVPNNCGELIDCGFFCGECQTCPSDTHICQPKPRGTACGLPGEGRCCLDGLCSPNASFCVV